MKQHFRILAAACCLLAFSANANSSLLSAVQQGDKAGVEALLAQGADVNAKLDIHGNTSLHKAAYIGKQDIVELLLAKGASVDAKDNEESTPLHRAVYYGHKNIVELLLVKGADIHAKVKNGSTALHIAAYRGERDIVELLLSKGADVHVKNASGKTALDAAVLNKDIVIAELINAHMLKQEKFLADQIINNPREAFAVLTARLKVHSTDNNTRRQLIKIASKMKPAPAIPEEARKHFVEGTAIVKAAKNPAQQALAAQSFTEALEVAPWWSDAYYNLGVAQELAERYGEAENAFALYLLSNPGEKESREVQDRIYVLSAKRKLSGVK